MQEIKKLFLHFNWSYIHKCVMLLLIKESIMKGYQQIFYIFILLFLFNCEDSGTNSVEDLYSGIIEGVDFDQLFAEPTSSELDAIYEEWESNSIPVTSYTILDTLYALIGSDLHDLHIVSHTNDTGILHYGAVISPTDTTLDKYPILFYNHGGDEGVDINAFISTLTFAPDLQELSEQFYIVIPSYRSESLIVDKTYTSTGTPSPWDKDIDDCSGMLSLVETLYPDVDMENVNVVGLSRGAGVAMLWAARDDRIKRVINFFGPTDLISDWTKEITYEALNGNLVELPGLDYLDENIIQPLKNNTLSINEARHELIKRSPVYFLQEMLPIQVHHGMEDEIVPVSQAERIIQKANELSLTDSEFQSYLYENSGHDQYTFIKGIDEMYEFIYGD